MNNKLKIYNPDSEFQNEFVKLYPEFANDNKQSEDDMPVKNITFVTTETCNLNCSYCYETHKSKKMMTKEVAKKAIDAIFDKEKMNGYVTDYNKAVIIEFIGGEPFINVDVMDFICEYFLYKATELNHPWAKYHMFSVTTNGTLLFDEKVMNWIQKYKRKLSLSITIDGNKELHDSCRLFHDGRGSYDIVEKAVKFAIKELGMKSTKVTFAPENINKINTAIPHLFNMGLTDIHANCVFENVWKPEHEPIFYHELLKLADYIIDNDLYETHFCSIFDEMIGAPMDPSDNKNWLISSQI